ncbi:MAG: hypothetical protein ACLRZE_03445 [Streptococcus salivarius]
MTGITQGLYYIERVQQYNSNIAGFPSDLINDRISSIVDTKKVDMQQSLRLLPVKNVVLNRERVSNLPPIEIPFESSLYYEVEENQSWSIKVDYYHRACRSFSRS